MKKENIFGKLIIFFVNILNLAFVKNVLTVSSGVVIAQIISLIASPLLTRLFNPEHFGLFAIFCSLTGTISVFSTLCYERAIVLPKNDSKAVNLLALSTSILSIICALSFLVTVIYRDDIAALFSSYELEFWLLLVPIAIFFTGLLNILKSWAVRKKYFRNYATASIIETTGGVLTKITIGFLIGASVGGLVSGILAGLLFALLFLLVNITSPELMNQIRKMSVGTIKEVASEYKKFPLFASWNAFLNSLSRNMVVFLLAVLFQPAVVGFYHLGKRVLNVPITFLSQSVNRVYFQKAAQQYANGQNIFDDFKKVTITLIVVGILPFGLIFLFGAHIFSFVFGKDWSEAGLYAQVLAPWLFLFFINPPSNVVYDVMGKQDIKLLYSIMLTLSRIVAIIYGYMIFKEPVLVLSLFSAVGVVFNIFFIALAYYFCVKYKRLTP